MKKTIFILTVLTVTILSVLTMTGCGEKNNETEEAYQLYVNGIFERFNNYYSEGISLEVIKKEIPVYADENDKEETFTAEIGSKIILMESICDEDDGSIVLKRGMVAINTANGDGYANGDQLRYRTKRVEENPMAFGIFETFEELTVNGQLFGIPWWGLLLILIVLDIGFFFLSTGFFIFGDNTVTGYFENEEFGFITLLNFSPAIIAAVGGIIFAFSSLTLWILVATIILASIMTIVIICFHIYELRKLSPLSIFGAICLNVASFLLLLGILIALIIAVMIALAIVAAIILLPIMIFIAGNSYREANNQIGNYGTTTTEYFYYD